MNDDNCKSQSEYIEKAIRFYTGYLDSNSETATQYMSSVLISIFKAELNGSEQRIARLLFKIAVKLGALIHIHAANFDIDDSTLNKLMGMCVEEVRRINGVISFEKAIEYQRSD